MAILCYPLRTKSCCFLKASTKKNGKSKNRNPEWEPPLKSNANNICMKLGNNEKKDRQRRVKKERQKIPKRKAQKCNKRLMYKTKR